MKQPMRKRLASLVLVTVFFQCSIGFAQSPYTGSPGSPPPPGPKCGSGSSIANARAAVIAAEKQKPIDSQKAQEDQAAAEAACQISINTDIIRNAIPDALNGIASLVSSFDPKALLSGVGAAAMGVLSSITSESACKVAKNAMSGTTRAVANIAGNAVNGVTSGIAGQVNSTINAGTQAINTTANNTVNGGAPVGTAINVPNVVAPTVAAPQVATQPTTGFFDSVTCRVMGGGKC